MLPESFTPAFLRQLELLKLQSRRAYLGLRQGGHLSLKRGHGVEFSDYRQYELGDNPRYIDWSVYARSDKLYIKTFREEQDLTVLVLVDTSSSMIVPREDRKWERACEIALAIAYVALCSQDQVRVMAMGGPPSPTYVGGRAFRELADTLLGTTPGRSLDLARECLLAASQVRFPGVCVFLSDFLMPISEIDAALRPLRAKNLDITLVQVLGPNDCDPLPTLNDLTAIDSETEAEIQLSLSPELRSQYRKLLDQHNGALAELCHASNIRITRAVSSDPLSAFALRTLTHVGLFT